MGTICAKGFRPRGARTRILLRRLLFLHNFSVDDWAIVLLAAFRSALSFGLRSGLASCGALASMGLFRSRLVKFRRNRLPDFVEFLAGRLHGRNVAALERFLHLVQGGFNFAAAVTGHLLLD